VEVFITCLVLNALLDVLSVLLLNSANLVSLVSHIVHHMIISTTEMLENAFKLEIIAQTKANIGIATLSHVKVLILYHLISLDCS